MSNTITTELVDGTIVEKGYCINTNDISEFWYYSDITCFAENASKAKAKFMNMNEVEGMCNMSGEEITFLTLRVKRCEKADKVAYKGQILSRSKIADLKLKEAHTNELDNILNNPDIEYCYIRKNGLYYKSNYCNYTEFRIFAGVYPKADAVSHCRITTDLSCIPIDIKEHNQYYQEYLDDIQSRVI